MSLTHNYDSVQATASQQIFTLGAGSVRRLSGVVVSFRFYDLACYTLLEYVHVLQGSCKTF